MQDLLSFDKFLQGLLTWKCDITITFVEFRFRVLQNVSMGNFCYFFEIVEKNFIGDFRMKIVNKQLLFTFLFHSLDKFFFFDDFSALTDTALELDLPVDEGLGNMRVFKGDVCIA